MTLADYRKIKPEEATPETPHGPGAHAHPGALEYVQIGVVLAVITAIEVGLYYIDLSHSLLVVMLIGLSALKFSLVVLWFMHLKFDNRLFSQLFVGGFLLALTIFMVALATLHGKLV
ncbi:MAG TPA: cytochrome C oxidase subunit IV family protein [Dehalococcoidia bacterium]|nr:cytochrome C oxidase subunit IV family protein [Dehalococcoidia bacterium]